MEDKTIITIVAIGAVVILESVAMVLGINGQLLATSLALLGGLAGVAGGYQYRKRVAE